MPYKPVLTPETCYKGLFDVKFSMVNLDLSSVEQKIAQKQVPFSSIIRCNLGNPQGVGQKPVTYLRQMIAGFACPDLIGKYVLPTDVEIRIKHILNSCSGKSSGSYQATAGIPAVVEDVAAYISDRDGIPCSPATICMANGATEAIMALLRPIIRCETDAILCPRPGFPLYASTIVYYGGKEVSYDLDESNEWALTQDALEAALRQCKDEGLTPRCLVLINPNNPTGSTLTEGDIKNALRFAYENNMMVMSDEVYQTNIYEPDDFPFISARKLLYTLNAEGECQGLELISIHSASKSIFGECGRRGGYWQAENLNSKFMEQIMDIISLGSTNTDGMVAMDVIVNPPRPGEPSYWTFKRECDALHTSLQRKARMVSQEMNSWKGLSCCKPSGAMYVFPRIHPPPAAIKAAELAGKEPDQLYCQDLLDNVGVFTLDGGMFGQKPGTYHLRMTILPSEEVMTDLLARWKVFHEEWIAKYSVDE